MADIKLAADMVSAMIKFNKDMIKLADALLANLKNDGKGEGHPEYDKTYQVKRDAQKALDDAKWTAHL